MYPFFLRTPFMPLSLRPLFPHQLLLMPFLLILLLLIPRNLSGQQPEASEPSQYSSRRSVEQPVSFPTPENSWRATVQKKLNLMGHRNWILVVDKAYPEQSSPGMTYIYVDQGLIPTLKEVLGMVEASDHVSPVIYRDLELNYLSDKEVPGIEAFRTESDRLFSGTPVQSMLHEEVFSLLDESSSLFTTLVIKTSCTLPYTSVFLQLDCAYWGPEDEKALRKRMDQ
ncbi:MAG: hypothetical protein ACWGNV_06240 [Bacteroidales bacterium]